MKRIALPVLATLLLIVSACRRGDGRSEIHSSLPQTAGSIPSGPALVADISELSEAPQAYAGGLVQVTGQYRRAPVIVCDGNDRPSPVTWLLVEGEHEIGARGFEQFVRPLLPSGLTVTVQGVWRHWRGPVGCGKDAPLRDAWHLVVTDFVAPSPVARVTLTPAGQAPRQTAAAGGEIATATATGTPQAASVTSTATATPTATQPSTRAATATPRTTSTSLPDVSATPGNGTASPTATVAATQEGATATATPGTVTATATAESGATPTASPTTATPNVVDQGNLAYQDLRGAHLDQNETHSWQFDVRSGDVITISVAANLETDIELVVLDPAGNRIVEQNQSPAGEIERIVSLQTGGSGGYRVVIGEADDNPTDYSLLLLNNNYAQYYNFVFAGLTSYGSSRSSQMAAESDQFWFFFGNNGEVINVNVSPNDDSNLFFDLYGTEGELLEDFVNEAGQGGAEQLLGFQLPATGLYAVRVGELEFEAASYALIVARN